jgi:hypothetical protein
MADNRNQPDGVVQSTKVACWLPPSGRIWATLPWSYSVAPLGPTKEVIARIEKALHLHGAWPRRRSSGGTDAARYGQWVLRGVGIGEEVPLPGQS